MYKKASNVYKKATPQSAGNRRHSKGLVSHAWHTDASRERVAEVSSG